MRKPEPANPVNMVSSPETDWTTVNFGEAIQGIQKPLSWGMWDLSMETSVRRCFGALGALPRSQVPTPESADRRLSGIFLGRAAGNVDMFRYVGDRMPGSSGDAIEEKVFGRELPADSPGRPLSAYARYPVALAKLPRVARRPRRELPAARAELHDWWQRSVLEAPPTDMDRARALVRESTERFMYVGELHTVTSMLGSGMLDELGKLAERATGDATLAMTLATGYGSMEETELIGDLWAASRGELDLDEVIRRHGYHGPDEGDLSSRVWREEPALLEALISSYRGKQMADPREREREQMERRREAEERLLAGLSALRRPGARFVMKLASTYIPLREVGKAAFLHTLDAVRCSGRVAGELLTAEGKLEEPGDAFFLTLDEFLDPAPGDVRATIAERRANHARYEKLELPQSWHGNPEGVPIAAAGSDNGAPAGGAPSELKGIGVVGERVTGRARVIHDPRDADLEPGDILVCATTDPSWTPLFMLTEALVIDMGGAMSHGAIVARELGVTCVINTVTGTRDIPDGATITVDGATGTVEIER